jgi:hypothetical protein
MGEKKGHGEHEYIAGAPAGCCMEHGAAQDSVCLTAYIRVVDLLSAY